MFILLYYYFLTDQITKNHSKAAHQLHLRDIGNYDTDQNGSGEPIIKFMSSLVCALTNFFTLLILFKVRWSGVLVVMFRILNKDLQWQIIRLIK